MKFKVGEMYIHRRVNITEDCCREIDVPAKLIHVYANGGLVFECLENGLRYFMDAFDKNYKYLPIFGNLTSHKISAFYS